MAAQSLLTLSERIAPQDHRTEQRDEAPGNRSAKRRRASPGDSALTHSRRPNEDESDESEVVVLLAGSNIRLAELCHACVAQIRTFVSKLPERSQEPTT